MNKKLSNKGERLIPGKFENREKYILYLEHLYAYEYAKNEIKKGAYVLEIGCGEGYGSNLLSENAGKIIALDVDEETIKHASKKYRSDSCEFKLYNGVKIPYDHDTFDIVVSFQVIEHIKDDRNFVSEIHRVLKKGGVVYLTTPNRIFTLKPGQKPTFKYHVREYYPEEFEVLLKEVFQDANVWGVRATEEVQVIEKERVRQIFDPRLDPLGFRKIIPSSVRGAIERKIKKIFPKNKVSNNDVDFLNRYSLKDYYVIKENVRESIHLLGICKK